MSLASRSISSRNARPYTPLDRGWSLREKCKSRASSITFLHNDYVRSSVIDIPRVGWEDILAMQTYSDRFRAYRKVMHRVLGSKAVTSRFNTLQDIEIRRFLLRVLQKPNDLVQHIRT